MAVRKHYAHQAARAHEPHRNVDQSLFGFGSAALIISLSITHIHNIANKGKQLENLEPSQTRMDPNYTDVRAGNHKSDACGGASRFDQ